MKTMPIYIMMSLMTAMPVVANASDSCLLAPQDAICKTAELNIYVGPQSVEPGEDIFIAVETLTTAGDSSLARSVVIINEVTGQRYETKVEQGLAYLELTAPKNAGRLTFRAQTGDSSSKAAEVLVHPGQAASFELRIEKNKGQAFITSSIIADKFGNFIDDGIRADIEFIGQAGVYASLQSLTQNGRIGHFVPCIDIKDKTRLVRARIGQAVQEIAIPAYICGGPA